MSAELHVIVFFCTDRGQHDPVGLGYSPAEKPRIIRDASRFSEIDASFDGSVYPGDSVLQRGAGPIAERRVYFQHPDPDDPLALRGMVTQLFCRECRRNPQRKMDALEEIIDALDAAGFTEIDISRLPF